MNKLIRAILILSLLITLESCGNVPSTEDLDKDIAELAKEIKEAKNEIGKYSGGLLVILLEIKKDILTNTQLMLEQKRSGLKRFININYNINGTKYLAPDNKNNQLKNLQDEIIIIQNDIAKAIKESNKYSGGLIKVLVDVKAATLENSLAFIKQKELLLKYDIPYYSIIPGPDTAGKGQKFKPTPGEDKEKF
ncbi:MAG: hypothetical protein ACYDIC_12540 [Desulfobaccales bacterium]